MPYKDFIDMSLGWLFYIQRQSVKKQLILSSSGLDLRKNALLDIRGISLSKFSKPSLSNLAEGI